MAGIHQDEMFTAVRIRLELHDTVLRAAQVGDDVLMICARGRNNTRLACATNVETLKCGSTLVSRLP